MIMGVHYEVVFTSFLYDDTPQETLDALRWHLGLLADRPPGLGADEHPDRLLCPDSASNLPGGDVASLQRQHREAADDGPPTQAWGLFSRTRWPEDVMPRIATIMELLAGQVADGGYGGYYRDETSAEATAFDFAGTPERGTPERGSVG
jgi:hypothetical protein